MTFLQKNSCQKWQTGKIVSSGQLFIIQEVRYTRVGKNTHRCTHIWLIDKTLSATHHKNKIYDFGFNLFYSLEAFLICYMTVSVQARKLGLSYISRQSETIQHIHVSMFIFICKGIQCKHLKNMIPVCATFRSRLRKRGLPQIAIGDKLYHWFTDTPASVTQIRTPHMNVATNSL